MKIPFKHIFFCFPFFTIAMHTVDYNPEGEPSNLAGKILTSSYCTVIPEIKSANWFYPTSTLLTCAIMRENNLWITNTSIVAALLERNKSPEFINGNETHPVHEAIIMERNVELEQLLLAGADPNKVSDPPTLYVKEKMTPLERALHIGNYDAAELLLTHKANPNQIVSYPAPHHKVEMSFLEHALYIDDHRTAELLLKHGADPNRLSCFFSELDEDRKEREQGLKPQRSYTWYYHGLTLFQFVVKEGYTDLVELCCQHNGNLSSTTWL